MAYFAQTPVKIEDGSNYWIRRVYKYPCQSYNHTPNDQPVFSIGEYENGKYKRLWLLCAMCLPQETLFFLSTKGML